MTVLLFQVVMKMLLCCSLALLLVLSCLKDVKSRAIPLSSCSVNVHTQELQKYYSDIRSDLLAGDNEIGTRTYTDVFTRLHQEGQMCCFMHLLMRFYIERVFSSYTSPQPINQRCSSALANAFVTIKRDIHKCHCHCGEETHRKIDSIHAEFTKLQVDTAARKAMGELNVVLEWLEGLGQNPAS
uniref:Interleukin family protein n=1 Tax=Cynoglossus semilaevis TaxID=244447 RepID=A0A3P8V1L5_CYNSE